MVTQQGQILTECKAQIEQTQKFSQRDMFKVCRLTECKPGSCKEVVQEFFSNNLKIERNINLLDDHQLDKS